MSRPPRPGAGREPGAEPFRALTDIQLIPHVVERLRGERGMDALLEASGVSRYAWTRAETGEHPLTPEDREKLAFGLGLTVDQLDDEIAHERAAYLRWLEARRSRTPESAALNAAIEELRCSTLKAGIDRIASGLKQMVDSYYGMVLERVRESARSDHTAEPRSEEVPQ